MGSHQVAITLSNDGIEFKIRAVTYVKVLYSIVTKSWIFMATYQVQSMVKEVAR